MTAKAAANALTASFVFKSSSAPFRNFSIKTGGTTSNALKYYNFFLKKIWYCNKMKEIYLAASLQPASTTSAVEGAPTLLNFVPLINNN